MKNKIVIRKFITDNELDPVMKIWLDTNIKAHDFIDESYWKNNFDYVSKEIRKANVSIALIDDAIVGFIGLVDDYIAGIFIKEEYQGNKIGHLLLESAKNDNEQLILNVYKNNKVAVNFYLKNGFKIIEESIDEDNNEVDLLMGWNK